jgi:hypothetical protein
MRMPEDAAGRAAAARKAGLGAQALVAAGEAKSRARISSNLIGVDVTLTVAKGSALS